MIVSGVIANSLREILPHGADLALEKGIAQAMLQRKCHAKDITLFLNNADASKIDRNI